MNDLTDLDYKDLFRDAVNMMAHIARAAGFDPADPTVEPPAIVARVENLRAEVERLTAERAAVRAALVDSGTEPVTEDMGRLAALAAAQLADEVATVARLTAELEEARRARAAETDLLRRLFATLHIGRRSEVLWSVVATVFGLGSTRAQELCERFGYDPHQRIATRRRAAMRAADAARPSTPSASPE